MHTWTIFKFLTTAWWLNLAAKITCKRQRISPQKCLKITSPKFSVWSFMGLSLLYLAINRLVDQYERCNTSASLLRGNCIPNQKFACFCTLSQNCQHLFLQNDVCILKQLSKNLKNGIGILAKRSCKLWIKTVKNIVLITQEPLGLLRF